jgi:DNA modification methylase
MTELIKIKDIKLNPNNPRLIKDAKFKKLVQSIKDFPEMLDIRPVVVNKDMIILGGNMRYKACVEAGIKEIPTIITDLTEAQQREFLIKDNTSGGEWDWDILANEWEAEQLEDWGLDLPLGFEVQPEAEEDDFDVPEGGIETDIVLGDLFEIGEHRLLCGDSTCSDTVAKLMEGEKADLMVTDPPYNVAYEGKTKEALTIENDKMSSNDFGEFLNCFFNCALIEMKSGAPIYVFCPIEDGSFLNSFLNSGFKLQSILVWLKNTIVLGRKDHQYKHEPILYGWKKGAAHKWYGDYDKSTIIECDKPPRNGEHPTMKPIQLLEKCINNSSLKNDLLLDLFLGSGSTMVASHQLKRKCYGMELDPKYCQVIVDRMIKLDPTLKIKRNGIEYVGAVIKQ